MMLRLTRGKFMGKLVGLDMLLLTTVGRKTGKKRYTPLLSKKFSVIIIVLAPLGGVTQLLSGTEIFCQIPMLKFWQKGNF
jgi:hypothetical protein